MKNNILFKILELPRRWLYVIYWVFIVFVIPRTLSWQMQLLFFLYALFIFWIVDNILKIEKKLGRGVIYNKEKYNKFFVYLLIFASIFILFTRFFLLVRFGEASLGYDTGFYLHTVATEVNADIMSMRALYFIMIPLRYLGFSPLVTFYFIYILSQLLIASALYLIFRSLKIPSNIKFASLGVFLFSTSLIQFLGYWSALGQQMLGTGFFLLTMALFLRKSPLAIFPAIMTFLTHTPTFVVMGLVFGAYYLLYLGRILFNRKYFNYKIVAIFGTGLLFMVVAFIFKQDQIFREINFLTRHSIFLKDYPSWGLFEARGGFIELSNFRFLILFLFPLSLFGFLRPSFWLGRRVTPKFFLDFLAPLYITFVALFILTFSPILYQSRFSIIFDIFLAILAAPTLLVIIDYFLLDKIGKVFVGILIMAFLAKVGFGIWEHEPLISNMEIEEIKNLSLGVESGGIIMATHSHYTPWLHGFSGRETIGPGHLYDNWSLSDWIEFWYGTDNNSKLKLLKTRQRPLYIFIGARQQMDQPYQEFIRTDPHFRQVSPRAWKYEPNL